MPWFVFTVRHFGPGLEMLAAEITGDPAPVYRTSGQVKAWTRWGARRFLRRRYGARLIEIVDVRSRS